MGEQSEAKKDQLDPAMEVQADAARMPVATPGMAVPMISVELMEKKAQEMMQAYDRLRQFAVSLTKPNEWRDYNGHPRLESGAAMRVGNMWGLNIDSPTITCTLTEDKEGPKLEIRADSIAHLRATGSSFPVCGTGSSRKDVWATRYRTIRGTRTKVVLPLEEVDEGNVIKAALTQMKTNAVLEVTGLKGVTWEELAHVTGDKITKAASGKAVDYRKGAQSEKAMDTKAEARVGEAAARRVIVDLAWWKDALHHRESVDLCDTHIKRKGVGVPWDEVRGWRTQQQIDWLKGLLAKLADQHEDLHRAKEGGEMPNEFSGGEGDAPA